MDSIIVKEKKKKEPNNKSMESLHTELIMEILSRVPTLDLLKLSSVCRRWRNIFNDPLFRQLHHTRSISKPSENQFLVWRRQRRESYLVDFTDITSPRQLEIHMPCWRGLGYPIVGSCNGLLCLVNKDDNSIFITNPCTHQHLHLSNLADKKIYSIQSWGFGFDEKNKLFKVVMFVSSRLMRYCDLEIRVGDLGSGGSINWRSIGVTTFHTKTPSCLTFVNGRLHWIYETNNRSRGILSFDLADEKFRPMPTPDCLLLSIDGIRCNLMRSLEGCLCIFYSQIFLESPSLQIWIMKEYGTKASWVKEVDTYPLIPRSLKPRKPSRFFGVPPYWRASENRILKGLGFGKDGEVIMMECNWTRDEQAVLFATDSTCNEFKRLQLESKPLFEGWIIYAASLNWI